MQVEDVETEVVAVSCFDRTSGSEAMTAAALGSSDEDVEGAVLGGIELTVGMDAIVDNSGDVREVVACCRGCWEMLLTPSSSSLGLESASATKLAFP